MILIAYLRKYAAYLGCCIFDQLFLAPYIQQLPQLGDLRKESQKKLINITSRITDQFTV